MLLAFLICPFFRKAAYAVIGETYGRLVRNHSFIYHPSTQQCTVSETSDPEIIKKLTCRRAQALEKKKETKPVSTIKMTHAVHGIFKKSIKKYAILKEQHLHGCENFFHFYFPFPTIFFFFNYLYTGYYYLRFVVFRTLC